MINFKNMENRLTEIISGLKSGGFVIFLENLIRKRSKKDRRRKYIVDLLEEMEFNAKISKNDWKRWREFRALAYTDAKSAKYLAGLQKELREKIYKSYAVIINFHKRQIEPLEGNVMEVYRVLDLKDAIQELKEYLKRK